MAVHEVDFPDTLNARPNYSSSRGPRTKTTVLEFPSGREQRIGQWTDARREYRIQYDMKASAVVAELETFWIAREGHLHSFRLRDWRDYTTATDHVSAPSPNDHLLGVGDGTRTTFQLLKKYTSGPVTRTRILEKITTGTTRVAFDGVEQMSGWTVDTTTGIITFTSAPGNGVQVTAGTEFRVPVRFNISEEWFNVASEVYEGESVQELSLIEVRGDGGIEDEFFYGGSGSYSMSADTVLSLASGRAQAWTATTGGLALKMPDATNLPGGGPYFYLINAGSNSIAIKTNGGTSIGTLGVGAAAELVLVDAGGGTKTWYMLT